MTDLDPRGRLKPCISCGEPTRANSGFCHGCRLYLPVDPLVTLVQELQPKQPVPFPREMIGQRVACEKHPDWFFTNDTTKITAAKYLCQSCPLKDWCAEFAVKNNEKGVWGGTSGADRRRIRRERKAA